MNVATDRLTKGPPVAGVGLSVPAEELPLPLLTLRHSAVVHNIDLLQRFCDERGALFAPHGKTTMSPDLFRAQIARGAWGITVADVQQALVCHAFGIRRVVLANQVVGAPNLAVLAEELNGDDTFDLCLWVDSPSGVAQLARTHAAKDMTRPWQVLLEIGWPGGRTGAQTQDAITATVRAITEAGSDAVALVGISVFEGLLDRDRLLAIEAGRPAPVPDAVEAVLEQVLDIALSLAAEGVLPEDFILTGGGSSSFDKAAEVFGRAPAPVRVVLRSGCYIAHDHGMYMLASPVGVTDSYPGGLRPALELWSYVTSIPERGRAFLGFGRRDVPFDHGLPVPLFRLRPGSTERVPFKSGTVTELHDQHAAMQFIGDLDVGDRIVLGISHPCGAFDRWRVIPILDDDGVVIDAYKTYF